METELAQLLNIALVGTILSGLITGIKMLLSQYGIDLKGQSTKIVTVTLAILVGTGMYLLQGTAILQSILGVLASASTVYAFLLKK